MDLDMAIIKKANNINIQVSGDYTSIYKVSHGKNPRSYFGSDKTES